MGSEEIERSINNPKQPETLIDLNPTAQIPLVLMVNTNHSLKAIFFLTFSAIFLDNTGGMKLEFGQDRTHYQWKSNCYHIHQIINILALNLV